MLRRRLSQEIHGSEGFISVSRAVAIVSVLAALGLGVNLGVRAWYNGRLMPGVVVAGDRVGGLTVEQVRTRLQQEAAAYRLRLTVAGQRYQLTAAQLGVSFDVEATLDAA